MPRHFPTELVTDQTVASIAALLAKRDSDLQRVLATYGPPPLWRRPAAFSTLVKIILEQQVSLTSAAAIFHRLANTIQPFHPEAVMDAGEAYLRRLGLTRQKASYLVHLSSAISQGELNLRRLRTMADADVKLQLMRVKGIGSWSADIYLLMALLRMDIWPNGDLALAVAVKKLQRLPLKPTPETMSQIAEPWRPYRAVAARMLWQYYLGERAN
ncbi:MAG: DNA-3-methyladenine glycosylase [Pyrinomonadaceae bacterium]